MIGRLPADTVVMDAVTADRLVVLAKLGVPEAERIYGARVPRDFLDAITKLDAQVDAIARRAAADRAESGMPSSAAGASSPLSVTSAADRLGRSERTVRQWCQTGKLNARRVGWQWVIDAEAVADLEETDAA